MKKSGDISLFVIMHLCVCVGGGGGAVGGAPFSWTIKTSSSSKLYLC